MADVDKRIYPAQEEPLEVIDDSKTIELEDPTLAELNGEDVPITALDNGNIVVGAGEMLPQQVEFGANLAEELDDSELHGIFNQCVADVEADINSRSEWEKQYYPSPFSRIRHAIPGTSLWRNTASSRSCKDSDRWRHHS